MLYANIGTSNLKSSKIILGTWQAGKDMWADIDDSEIIKAIRTALDCGINTIDTAAVYGAGYSERIICNALENIDRQKYYLATKVFADNLHYENVIKECEKSLRHLKTDYIDLYQIHWPAGSFNTELVPIQETMEALNHLKNTGKILHIGVSNFSKAQLEEALQYGEIVSNQPPYSLIWRPYDQETNPFCRANDIGILSYSPLAQGILTGKFKPGHKFHKDDHRTHNRLMQPTIFPYVQQVLAGLQPYADKYNTTLGNIALNWLISQPNTFAITGVRNLEQITSNSKCCDFSLNNEELAAIDSLSHIVTDAMAQDFKMWDW